MASRLDKNTAICKYTANLTADLEIEVPSGHRADVILNNTKHSFLEGKYNVVSCFKDAVKTQFLAFGIAPGQTVTVYLSKKEFLDKWGVCKIPYRTDEGKDVKVGCNGNIRYEITNPQLAYDWLSNELEKDGNTPIAVRDVWNAINIKLEKFKEIVNTYISVYYKSSKQRDGMDFDAYKEKIIRDLSEHFHSCGFDIIDFMVCNIADPVIDSGDCNVPEAPVKNKPEVPKNTKCPRCTTVNEPGTRNCVRCGLKLN